MEEDNKYSGGESNFYKCSVSHIGLEVLHGSSSKALRSPAVVKLIQLA